MDHQLAKQVLIVFIQKGEMSGKISVRDNRRQMIYYVF